MLFGEEQFGGIADLSESGLLHFVDAQLGGGAEAVLDAAQDAVHVVLVAFELYDGVDDVLEDFRTCQCAFLRDVADEDDGHAAGLGKAEQGRGALTHLCDGAGRGLDILGGDGLYGVDNDEFGLDVLDMLEDGFEGILAEDH